MVSWGGGEQGDPISRREIGIDGRERTLEEGGAPLNHWVGGLAAACSAPSLLKFRLLLWRDRADLLALNKKRKLVVEGRLRPPRSTRQLYSRVWMQTWEVDRKMVGGSNRLVDRGVNLIYRRGGARLPLCIYRYHHAIVHHSLDHVLLPPSGAPTFPPLPQRCHAGRRTRITIAQAPRMRLPPDALSFTNRVGAGGLSEVPCSVVAALGYYCKQAPSPGTVLTLAGSNPRTHTSQCTYIHTLFPPTSITTHARPCFKRRIRRRFVHAAAVAVAVSSSDAVTLATVLLFSP